MDDDDLDSRTQSIVKRTPSQARPVSHKRKRKDNGSNDEVASVKTRQPVPLIDGGRFSFSKPTNGVTQAGPPKPDADSPPLNVRARLEQTKQSLLTTRKSLPIWSKQEEIRAALGPDRSQVLILTGATGSGKSTQLPQFLVDEGWMKGGKKRTTYSAGCIAVTQPRRVAAVGLASRVAAEMGLRLGRAARGWNNDEVERSVGCAVRFDNNVSRSKNVNTVVKFLTEGVLLRELIEDPGLSRYSVVVVDEVHERSLDVDFILGFLRLILTGQSPRPANRPLKVVVMSATADVDALRKFFADGFIGAKPETSAPDELPISICEVPGRLFPIKYVYLSQPSLNLYDSCLEAVKKIHSHEGLPGDILVFLPGKDPIENLERLIADFASKMDKKLAQIMVLPLFAAMPADAQKKIFETAPRGTRRIILATNIAETSITVPGVRHVVDCGKAKVKKFHSTLGLSSLLAKPISQSSAIQRAGRAGREGPGTCHRLYTQADFNKLEPEPIPEILRCDLTSCLLGLKARGIDDVQSFPFLSPPSPDAIYKGLIYILSLGALNPADGKITPTGKTMSLLPLPPMLAKIVVHAASNFGPSVMADAIDLVSALSVESIFLDPGSQDSREAAADARARLLRREGDHQTLVSVVQAYLDEKSDRKAWARQHWISYRAMAQVVDIRKQLIEQCSSLGLGSATDREPEPAETSSSSSSPPPLVQCLLAAFGTHTARLMPDRTYSTFIGNQKLAIHPSSVLFGRRVPPEAIVFTEHVYTSKSYARGVTMIQMDWMDPVNQHWHDIAQRARQADDK